MSNRLLRLPILILVALMLAVPTPALGADPTLGEAVTLPDGTVLPPMPVEQIAPSAQSQMLEEQGGLVAEVGSSVAPLVQTSVAEADVAVEPAAPLTLAESAAVGPAGPLPNQLTREVLGFLPYWKLDSTTRAALRMDLMSTIAYFSIGVQSNGYLARGSAATPTAGWQGWTSSAMTAVINAAHQRGVRVVPTITMMAWNGDYSAMSGLLNSSTYRARLVADVVKVVGDRRADGVNIDFEPVPSSLRAQFTSFVRQVKTGLVNARVGSFVTVDTMAGAATWSTGYDVAALSATGAADALMVMAYDFSYAASARAGGVAPMDSSYIFSATDAMRDHLARVPASKLIWGVPHYGRAWNTTGSGVNSTVRSPVDSVAFTYYGTSGGAAVGGKVLAAAHGRRWDTVGQVPWFLYRAADGGYRQGYYDDPTSLRAKYDMVLKNDVAGIGIWSLGMDTGVSDLWNVIEDRFLKLQTRLAGADRYATAARISAASFAPGVPIAYVATGVTFPDALAAGPAAAKGGGPVLLAQGSALPSATTNELARLKPARIVVLGSSAVINDAAMATLRTYATSGSVTRIAGADRYATAARASAATFAPGVPVAYVATGLDFPDALAGGVAAGRQKGPMLLVRDTSIPAAAAAELTRLKPAKIVVLGGPSVVSDDVAAWLRTFATTGSLTRLAGADRYATAIAVSRATTGNDAPRTVYVATGSLFADGLSATPAAARANGPLLVVPGGSLTAPLAAELRRLNPPRVVILGGPSSVSNALAAQIAALWD
ncbi:MAG: cell wall-binding repeat-containing protein [Chloroflexi bacterium]|nr:cell wall-binding repeat-containing protein [Chloroflexota bacterium]